MLNGYLHSLLVGLTVTIKVALCSLGLGLILGLIGAVGESTKGNVIKYIFKAYHAVIRGVPELLILFFIYFGSSQVLRELGFSGNVSSFAAGVVALAILFGAYASQTLRGAFRAVPAGQIEAAHALGLQRIQTFFRIQLPQAWRHALPGLSNLWQVLLKDTALVSLIGLSDLMMRTQSAAVTTQLPFTFYLAAATIYLILTSISELMTFYFYKRLNRYL